MNIQIKNKFLKEFLRVIGIMLGCAIMGFAFNCLFYANNVAPSGLSGLAAVISDFLADKIGLIRIEPTILYLIFNIGIMIWAFFVMGKKYIIYSFLGILSYSLAIKYINFNIGIKGELFLSAVFGAILLGFGTGLVVRLGGSTGGGEMLGNIMNKYKPNVSVGTFIVVIDLIILAFSFVTYGLVNSLYTILAIYIDGIVVDKVLSGGKETQAFYIITDKYKEISNTIMSELHRGVTLFNAKGMYTNEDKFMLLCLVDKNRASRLKELVFDLDDKALLFDTTVSEAYGNGFQEAQNELIKKLKKKKLDKIKRNLVLNKESTIVNLDTTEINTKKDNN